MEFLPTDDIASEKLAGNDDLLKGDECVEAAGRGKIDTASVASRLPAGTLRTPSLASHSSQ